MIGGARRFGAHIGSRGAGHIVAAVRLQLVSTGRQFDLSKCISLDIWVIGVSILTSMSLASGYQCLWHFKCRISIFIGLDAKHRA